jgi:hypothetical protein
MGLRRRRSDREWLVEYTRNGSDWCTVTVMARDHEEAIRNVDDYLTITEAVVHPPKESEAK